MNYPAASYGVSKKGTPLLLNEASFGELTLIGIRVLPKVRGPDPRLDTEISGSNLLIALQLLWS